MPSFIHQPGFDEFPVRCAPGLWQPSSRWEATDYDYFARMRQSATSSLFAAPKIYRHKRKGSPSCEAFWVFKIDDKAPAVGWAELQSFPGKRFAKGFLFFSLNTITGDQTREAVIALTSLIFALGTNDHLHLIPSRSEQSQLLEPLAALVGTLGQMHSLPLHPGFPSAGGFQTMISLAVDRVSWRACTAFQDAQRSMKHIEMRRERLERMEQGPGGKRRKRPFLVRLFKPRIDDSLF